MMNSFLVICAILLPVLQISAEVPLPHEKYYEELSCIEALQLKDAELCVAASKIASLTKQLHLARKQVAESEKHSKLKESGTSILFNYDTEEYEAVMCEWKAAQLSCGNGEKIEITYANYGRLDYTTCPNTNMHSINCSSNKTMPYVTNACNGKVDCSIAANFQLIGEDPCYGTGKYLRVTYKCVKACTACKMLSS